MFSWGYVGFSMHYPLHGAYCDVTPWTRYYVCYIDAYL